MKLLFLKYVFYNTNIMDAELHRTVCLQDYRFKHQILDKTFFPENFGNNVWRLWGDEILQ